MPSPHERQESVLGLPGGTHFIQLSLLNVLDTIDTTILKLGLRECPREMVMLENFET
jgi:hypothetical protein